MKQTLRIKTFIGRSENAVRMQVIAAVIVYIIMKIIHQKTALMVPFQNFMAMVSMTIFQRIPIAAVIERATRRTSNASLPPAAQYLLPL